jgi:predicted dehydrogenase
MARKELIIQGGLGAVSLLRKLPFLYDQPLSDQIKVSCLVDTYPKDLVKNPAALDSLLTNMENTRLVSKISTKVRENLIGDIATGKLEYFHSGDLDSIYNFIANSNCPIIDISTPNRTHNPVLKECIKRSSADILLEKPSACDLEDLSSMQSFLSESQEELRGRLLFNLDHYLYYANTRQYLDRLEDYISGELLPKNKGLGKVKGIQLKLEETEGFDKQRNRDIINIGKSGGGVSLDLAVHCIQFLDGLGARISFPPRKVISGKIDDPSIQGSEYGETEFYAEFLTNGENFVSDVPTTISVGKARGQKKKNFYVFHENGVVDLSMDRKELTIYSLCGEKLLKEVYPKDPFQNAYEHFVSCVEDPSKPVKTSLTRSVNALNELFNLRNYATQRLIARS